MKRLLLLAAAAAMTLAADSRYHEDFHYNLVQSPGGRLTIENFNGSIEIAGWDQNRVDISGTKYADSESRLHDVRVDVSNHDNVVAIRTTRPDMDHRGNCGAKYVIRVPRQIEIERLHSSNGSVRIEEINGNVVIETSNGSIRINDVHGNIDAHSSNGSVEVRKV